jgi:hypothetical protein
MLTCTRVAINFANHTRGMPNNAARTDDDTAASILKKLKRATPGREKNGGNQARLAKQIGSITPPTKRAYWRMKWTTGAEM